MSTSVFCIANSEAAAARIASRLETEGFSGNDVSVLLPDRSGSRDFAHEHSTKAPEGAAAGAGAGGILGGAVGWLAGVGALAIPGAGPFIAAGPIMAALSGAALGATAGGLTGGLIGLGIPEFEARRYEAKIKGGNILISVHSENHDQTDLARQIFEEEGAEDISAGSEKSPPAVTTRPADRAKVQPKY